LTKKEKRKVIEEEKEKEFRRGRKRLKSRN
jgi:hypothetical protein